MLKECKNTNDSKEQEPQRRGEEWHYEFASKMIDSWPEWKKEIYEANYSSPHKKK